MAKETDGNYGHILKYTGVFGGVQGLNILMGLVRNKLVALLLGPEGMGLASLFNTTTNFISQSTNLGLSFSAVTRISAVFETHDEAQMAQAVKTVRAWSLLTALVGMLVCVLAGPLLSEYTFSWGNHTLHFILLAPAVGLMAITGGETAILKGARRLRSLAVIQVYAVIASLLVSVPVYYFFGQTGIVPVIVLLALVMILLTIRHSYRLYPLRLRGSQGVLGDGLNMVRLGVAFVVAGAMGSGAEMFVRSYLNVHGDLEAVGLYNAGYILIVTYASMVFSAMETDYFPRLSSLGDDVARLNQMVNRQIEVSLLIVSPMLAALIIGLPVLIPLLYSHDFLPVIAMAQVAVFSMYMTALSLPVGYITLAKGDSVAYMVLEGCYDVLFVALLVVGYQWWGLYGAGVALSISYLSDLALVGGWAAWRYHYRVSGPVMYYAAIQLSLGVAVYLVSLLDHPWLYWSLGILLCLVSLLISLYILHQKTSLWTALIDKFKAHARS